MVLDEQYEVMTVLCINSSDPEYENSLDIFECIMRDNTVLTKSCVRDQIRQDPETHSAVDSQSQQHDEEDHSPHR